MIKFPSQVRSLKRQSGVTMIEVLVSIAIFSFGLLGAVGLQATVINQSINAENRVQAALLADEIVAAMWLKGTASLPASDISAWQSRVSSSKLLGSQAVGTLTPSASNPKQVTVDLSWSDASNKAAVTAKYQTIVVLP